MSAGTASCPVRLGLWSHVYAFLLVAGAALEAMIKAAGIQAHLNVEGFKAVVPTWVHGR